MTAITIEIINSSALRLLQELETLNIIRFVEPVSVQGEEKPKKKLSDKYRSVLSETEGKSLDKHVSKMRKEWNNS